MRRAIHTEATRLIKSVLDYLNGMERLAAITNDRNSRVHFEECWSVVWRAYYGGYSVPSKTIIRSLAEYTAPVPAARPAWMIAKYAKPTRKVVARTTEHMDMGKRMPPAVVHFDVLECGHKLIGNENLGAAPPAKHRRCPLCVPAEKDGAGTGHDVQSNNREASQMAVSVRRVATRY